MNKTILITGGELHNKGAQAMTFVVVSEMAKRFPDLTPVLLSPLDCAPDLIDMVRGKKIRADSDNLAFRIEYGNTPEVNDHYLGASREYSLPLKSKVRKAARRKDILKIAALYENAAFIIDVSGFAFGAQWGYFASMHYLRSIELARRFGVSVYLLPQSFGPFEFEDAEKGARIRSYAGEVLRYPKIIFPRESSGFDSLLDLCPEATLVRSNDLVLQNKEINLESIFKDPLKIPKHPEIDIEHAVGIVPNMRNDDHGDTSMLTKLYLDAMERLLMDGYSILLVRHAKEDIAMCEKLKSFYPDDTRVRVVGEDRYCFEYDEIFARCEFLIASRYHSIVHSYRRGTPCISLGWAVKYQELLGLFGQERFVFNVSDGSLHESAFFEALTDMEINCTRYRSQIEDKLAEVQRESVFDLVGDSLLELVGSR